MNAARRPTGESRVLEFEIPSDVRFIERVVDAVRDECRRLRYDERQVRLNVPVALTEAMANAIIRGNGDDQAKSVLVVARVDAIRLVMEVADQGAGFDLAACTSDPTTAEHLTHEDGRGLYLMLQLMDEVERLESEGRNVVRMTLRRVS